MNANEMAARLIVLEVFCMTMSGIMLANSPNDPDYSKGAALIDMMVQTVRNSRFASEAEKAAAVGYAQNLADQLRGSLRTLRGEAGPTH